MATPAPQAPPGTGTALDQRPPRELTPAQHAVEELILTVRSDGFGSQIEMVLPEGVSRAKVTRTVVTALMKDEALATADRASFFASVLQAAQDGLVPDGREAALVAYKGKVTYLPMVGGIRKRAADYGWDLVARVVHAADTFDYEEGLDPVLRHRPAPGTVDQRGDRIYAYAVARHRDGRKLMRVLDAQTVAKHRSKAQTDNVWKEWPEPMWEKTAAHALFKELPLSVVAEERARVHRMIAAWEEDPSKAIEALYGHTPILGELPAAPATPTDVSPADDAAPESEAPVLSPQGTGAADGSQADPSPSYAEEGSAPSTDNDDADDPPPPPATETSATAPTDEMAEARAKAALLVTLPENTQFYGGLALGEMLERGPETHEWFAWALKPQRAWNKADSEHHVIGQAIAAVVAHHLPDIWAAQEGREAA